VALRDVGPKGRTERVVAAESARAALAESLGIPAIKALSAELRIDPAGAGSFHVRGTVTADVVQTCVVTLDEIDQHVSEPVHVVLVPQAGRAADEAALVDPLEEEAPQLVHRGRIELGSIVAEHLALGLDPYPRRADADFPPHVEDEAGGAPSPFARLRLLKRKG
jgi:uncharacterized metal-binding protein YceD (DUF177 family)